jgi:mono/diheme cytochrome c family protein
MALAKIIKIEQKNCNKIIMKHPSKFVFALPLIVTLILLSFSFKKQTFDLKASMERGKELYITYCLSCHMDSGQGVENVYPPLAKADYLIADKKRSIQQVLYGAEGEMKVNGKTFNQPMLGFDLKDEEVSDILNYVRNSFDNKGEAIKPADVKAVRK